MSNVDDRASGNDWLRATEGLLRQALRQTRHAAALVDEELHGGVDPVDPDSRAFMVALRELAEARVCLRESLSSLRLVKQQHGGPQGDESQRRTPPALSVLPGGGS